MADLHIVLREKDLEQFSPAIQEALQRIALQQLEEPEAQRADPGGWKPPKILISAEQMRTLASSQYRPDGTTIAPDLTQGPVPWRPKDATE